MLVSKCTSKVPATSRVVVFESLCCEYSLKGSAHPLIMDEEEQIQIRACTMTLDTTFENMWTPLLKRLDGFISKCKVLFCAQVSAHLYVCQLKKGNNKKKNQNMPQASTVSRELQS